MNAEASMEATTVSTVSKGPTAPVPDGMPDGQRGRAMLVILLGLTLAVIDSSIVNLALPDMGRELQASASQSIWVVNAYQIATLVLLLPLAALGDRMGYRRVYLVGMVVFTLSSVATMLATSMPALIAARALQGLGAAGVLSVNAAMVRLIYPRAALGRGMAINSLVVAAASMAGPLIAAAILSVATWPWLFAINLPLGCFIVWLGRTALPTNPPSKASTVRFSALDVVLNIAMFTLVFVGADQLSVRSGGTGSSMATGVWLLLAGVAVGVVYLRRQWPLAAPLFPVDLLRIPVFALSMASSVTAFCSQSIAMLALPFLLLDVYGQSHVQAGLLLTAWPLAIAVVAPLAGRLIGRVEDGLLGGIGMLVFAAGLLALAWLPAQPADWAIVWPLLVCGAGFALFQSPNNHTIVSSPPVHRAGAASGMLGTARLTGQTLGAVIVATVFALWPEHNGRGEAVALALAAGCAVLAAVCSSLRLRGKGH